VSVQLAAIPVNVACKMASAVASRSGVSLGFTVVVGVAFGIGLDVTVGAGLGVGLDVTVGVGVLDGNTIRPLVVASGDLSPASGVLTLAAAGMEVDPRLSESLNSTIAPAANKATISRVAAPNTNGYDRWRSRPTAGCVLLPVTWPGVAWAGQGENAVAGVGVAGCRALDASPSTASWVGILKKPDGALDWSRTASLMAWAKAPTEGNLS